MAVATPSDVHRMTAPKVELIERYWADAARKAQPVAAARFESLASRNQRAGARGTMHHAEAMPNIRMSHRTGALHGIVYSTDGAVPAAEVVPDPSAVCGSVAVYQAEAFDARSLNVELAALNAAMDALRDNRPFADASVTDSVRNVVSLGERNCSASFASSLDPHTFSGQHWLVVRCYDTEAARAVARRMAQEPDMTLAQLHASAEYRRAVQVGQVRRNALALAFAQALKIQLRDPPVGETLEGLTLRAATPHAVAWYNVVEKSTLQGRETYAYYADAYALSHEETRAIPFGISRAHGYELLGMSNVPVRRGTREALYGFPMGSPKRPAAVRTKASVQTSLIASDGGATLASTGVSATVTARAACPASAVRWGNGDMASHPKMVVGAYDVDFVRCPHNLELLAQMGGYPVTAPHVRLAVSAAYLSSVPESDMTVDDIMRLRHASAATVRLPLSLPFVKKALMRSYLALKANEAKAGRSLALADVVQSESDTHLVAKADHVQKMIELERERERQRPNKPSTLRIEEID